MPIQICWVLCLISIHTLAKRYYCVCQFLTIYGRVLCCLPRLDDKAHTPVFAPSVVRSWRFKSEDVLQFTPPKCGYKDRKTPDCENLYVSTWRQTGLPKADYENSARQYLRISSGENSPYFVMLDSDNDS